MRKLGRKKDNREHLIRNLASSLILFERVDTTEAKAKEVKSFLDKIIARNKKADLNTKRALGRIFFDPNVVKKVLEELVPRYTGRASGYIKSYHLKNRLGDNSVMMRLELVDKKVFVSIKAKKEKVEAVVGGEDKDKVTNAK